MKSTFALILTATLATVLGNNAHAAPTAPAAKPIRMAHVKATISKQTVDYSTMKVDTAIVCNVEDEIPVYGVDKNYASLKNLPACSSKVQGENVQIVISTELDAPKTVLDGSILKAATAILNIYGGSNSDTNSWTIGDAGTEDMSAKSIYLYYSSQLFKDAKGVEESFYVSLKYDDLNQ